MKFFRSNVLPVLSLLTSVSAFAGGNISGGGNSRICFRSEETAALVRTRGLRNDYLAPSADLVESINFVDEIEEVTAFLA